MSRPKVTLAPERSAADVTFGRETSRRHRSTMIDDDSAGALRRGARTNRSAADKPARPQKRASTDLNPMSRTPDRFQLSCEAPTGGARCEEKTMKYVIDLDEKLRRSGQMVYNEGLRSVARSLGRSVARSLGRETAVPGTHAGPAEGGAAG
jgi:hypothetical protein